MKLAMSIILAVGVFFLFGVAEWIFRSSDNEERKIDAGTVVAALGIGCLAGVINYFVPKFVGNIAFLAPISLAVMVSITGYVMYWWAKEGATVVEMLPFIGLSVVVYFTTQAAAIMTAAMIPDQLASSLVIALPKVMLILSIGFYAIDTCLFYMDQVRDTDLVRLLLAVSAIGTVVALVIVLFQVNWGSIGQRVEAEVNPEVDTEVSTDNIEVDTEDDIEVGTEVDAEVGTEVDADTEVGNLVVTAEPAIWYKFYNLELRLDADPANDFNFGSKPNAEGLTVYDYARMLRERMKEDPALAAADMAWLDAIVGTRYLGEFYESCKGDWAKTINLTKEKFMENQGLFYQTLDAFFAFMDSANSIELEYRTGGLEDQMYMNPFTANGAPDVIVMTTTDQTGYFLTFTFLIKGNEFRVAYRVDCGFQPTNVEKVMDIKPNDAPRENNPGHSVTPNSDPKPKPGGKDSPPDPTPKSDPTPKPDPTPTKKKDKTKGTKVNTEPNDDPGPGPDTNNGVGATTSTKDQPTNSNHMTLNEYKEEVKELREINESQKTGNDPSTPSTTGPTNEEVHVDSNADKGTGNGGINTPTEKSDPATVADTNQPISNSPGEAWEGPMD